MVEAVNWENYFFHIKEQCPWSWAAWRRGNIWIGNYRQGINSLDEYQARIYIVKNINPRKLKKIANNLNNKDINCEWLWSHPRYKKYSTPVPTLIQQNRARLYQLRSSLEDTL